MRNLLLLAVCFASLTLLVPETQAQNLQISNNDPVNGRIGAAKEIHTWEVEVADLRDIEFAVDCKTAALYAQVIRVRDGQLMSLDPIQGTNSSHFNGGKTVVKASNAAVPKIGPFSARTSNPLNAGKYRIIVGSPGEGQIGPYQLTVTSPKFQTDKAPAANNGLPQAAGQPANLNPAAVNNQAVLVQILAELKRLNERVEKLEKQRSDE
jgi:hypothetical protein